jgi:hypothetical protein
MNLPAPRPGRAPVRQPVTLNPTYAIAWVNERGLNRRHLPLTAVRLAGGVSAEVVAVRGPAFEMVLKQALPRLLATRPN